MKTTGQCLYLREAESLEDDDHHHQKQLADSLDMFQVEVDIPRYRDLSSNVFERLAVALSIKSMHMVEYFLHLEFFDESTVYKDVDEDENKSAQDKYSSRKKRIAETLSRLTRIHSLIYILAFIWCSLNVFYLYCYDIDHFKYTKFREMFIGNIINGSKVHNNNNNNNKSARILQQLELNLNQSRSRLSSLGSPFIEVHFFVATIYAFALIFSLITSYQGLLVFAMNRPTSYHIGRIGTDPLRETRSLANLIHRLLLQFQTSSRQFDQITLGWLSRNMKYLSSSHRTDLLRCCNSINDNQMILEHLRRMAADNYRTHLFDPLSWRHPNVVKLLPRVFGLVTALLIIYSMLVLLGTLHFLTSTITYNVYLSSLIEHLTLASFAIVSIYTFIPVSLICSAFLINALEQTTYMICFIDLIYVKVAENNEIVSEIYNNDSNRCNQIRLLTKAKTKINSNLLLCIFHLKLFVKMFRVSEPLSSMVLVDGTCLLYLLPIMVRLNMAYVEVSGARLFSIVLCLATVFFYDCLLLPACYFHSQSLELYRAFNSLQAHIIASSGIQWITNITETSGQAVVLYNEHLVALLRRELSHPDRLINRFAHRMAGINFTYSTFIKVHFWFGLIVISLLSTFDANDHNTFLGGFLRDPFNLIVKPH